MSSIWLWSVGCCRRTLGEILNQVKRHWKDNQNTIKDFTTLKRQPVVEKVKDKFEQIKDRLKKLRNRLHELVDRRI